MASKLLLTGIDISGTINWENHTEREDMNGIKEDTIRECSVKD